MLLWEGKLTHQSAKCNGGSQAGEVDEEECGEALDVEPIFDVRQVHWEAALDVSDHASECPASSPQRVAEWIHL